MNKKLNVFNSTYKGERLMLEKTHDKRQRILTEAYRLLTEVKDAEKVTIREIAKRAEVGVGLVNYHFASKDAMLMEAIGSALAAVAIQWQASAEDLTVDPRTSLKNMLDQLMTMGAEHFHLIQLAAKFELTEGDVHTPSFILPFIRRITGLEDQEAKLVAFFIISNLQSATLRAPQFKAYTGLDLENAKDRTLYLERLLHSHLSI